MKLLENLPHDIGKNLQREVFSFGEEKLFAP
jgi:hypothetical protein